MKFELSGRPRLLTGLVGSLAIAVFLVSGWVAWFSYDLTAGLPDGKALRGLSDMAQATTLYDADDTPVFTIFKEQRIEVPLEKMSPHFIKAVLSIEDQRFYEHSGVDAIRVAAAALRNVQEGRRAEGGSTITQQLARQSFLSRDKTYRRKLKEVILAAHIEGVYEKGDILALYLNKVYLGDGLYGVEAASRGYFGKPAAELEIPEAALLAGLIQSPSSYAPTVNLERALARRNVVLTAMASTGAIDAETAEKAKRSEVKLDNGLELRESYGLYVKEHVRRELVDRFGWARVYQGGLKVYTTMDSRLQQEAEKLLEKGITDIESRRGFKGPVRGKQKPGEVETKEGESPGYLQGALVSMDPTTGHVLAMVGGRDFTESRFNRATQAKRQSGSAFKPFVFAAALESGLGPSTLIHRLNDPIETLQGKWVPEDEHSTASSMSMRTALKTSSNRAAVQLLNTVGIDKAVASAEKLNVGTPPSVPSLALGTSDVTLAALTAAYGAFAAEGIVRPPVLIRKVEDSDGNVLYEDEQTSHRAISEATAYLMSSMLADVVNHGTGYRARQAGFTLPAAGKTGTTNDYVDAWFVGYTPRVVTGVWIGFDQPQTIIANGYGGELAVPVWAGFMKAATAGHKKEWFERPEGVVAVNVCRVSGRRATEACGDVEVISSDGYYVESRSMIYTEYFAKGSAPTAFCDLHTRRSVLDRITGALGADNEPAPVSASEVGMPPSPARTTGAAPPRQRVGEPPPTPQPAPKPEPKVDEEKKKKPGFWGRLFGRGDKDKKDEKKDPPKKKPGGGR